MCSNPTCREHPGQVKSMLSDKETEEVQKLKNRIKELEDKIDEYESWECASCGHQSLNCGGDFINTQDYDPSW